MKNQLIDRLTRYTTIDTQSDPKSTTTPSTEKQWDLLHLLEKELQQLGLPTDLDENGYLFATLESNIDVDVPTVGFLAHVDTSPDFNASNVKPQIIENYDGKPYKLGNTKRVLDPKVFPELNSLVGHTLMVTDGTSLLGADDKAGIVEIMEAICYLQKHPEIKHVPFALDLHQTKKSVVVHINLMLTASMPILLILWMVVNMENYNMKALTLLKRLLHATV